MNTASLSLGDQPPLLLLATARRLPSARQVSDTPHENACQARKVSDAPDENGLHPPPEGPRFDFLRGADATGRPLLAQKT